MQPSPTYAAHCNEIASLRDATAELRDRAAEARDRTASDENRPGEVSTSTFAAFRRLAAADRASAARDRSEAGRDRRFATEAGLQAPGDRTRDTGGRDGIGLLDALTGAYSTGFGVLALHREIDRSRAVGEPFVLVVIEVEDLDELRQVAVAVTRATRACDPLIRLPGSTFLCGLTDTDLTSAHRRVEMVQSALRSPAAPSARAAIRVGLAELESGDTLATLTARATRDIDFALAG
jgi:GGDEF domain-containing protein